MKHKQIPLIPDKRREMVFGLAYIPIHAVILPFILAFAFIIFNINMNSAYQTLIYYAVSFVVVLCFMLFFLRESFEAFISNFVRGIVAVLTGFIAYLILFNAAAIALAQTNIMLEANPNSAAIAAIVPNNFNVMFLTGVVLAPIVEEAIFRGALFGIFRKKSRILAYLVSTIFFAVYHLWAFMLLDFNWNLVFMLIQYIPGAIALAWTYERGGTIWSPIILHGLINAMALNLSR